METKARYFTSEFIRIRCIILNCIDQSSETYETEFITDRRPLLSISASELKTYTDNVGPFHPVKLLLHAHGHYEVRVNIEHAETGKYEFDNFDFLRGLITNVSNQSPLHICPGLRDIKTWTQSSDACRRKCSARNGLGLLLTTWDTFKFKVFNLAYAKKKKNSQTAFREGPQ